MRRNFEKIPIELFMSPLLSAFFVSKLATNPTDYQLNLYGLTGQSMRNNTFGNDECQEITYCLVAKYVIFSALSLNGLPPTRNGCLEFLAAKLVI